MHCCRSSPSSLGGDGDPIAVPSSSQEKPSDLSWVQGRHFASYEASGKPFPPLGNRRVSQYVFFGILCDI